MWQHHQGWQCSHATVRLHFSIISLWIVPALDIQLKSDLFTWYPNTCRSPVCQFYLHHLGNLCSITSFQAKHHNPHIHHCPGLTQEKSLWTASESSTPHHPPSQIIAHIQKQCIEKVLMVIHVLTKWHSLSLDVCAQIRGTNTWYHQLLLHHAVTCWSPISPSFWPLLFLEIFWNCTHKKSLVAATNPFFSCTQDLMWLRKNLQCSE